MRIVVRIVVAARRWSAGGVEVLDIDGRPRGERLDLALAELLARRACDRRGRLLERSPRSLDRGQPPQPVRVLLWGEVQPAVSRIEVGVAAAAVGQPGDRDDTEDRRERAGVSGLDRAVAHVVGVFDLIGPPLPQGAQLQLPLHHLAQQLPAPSVELVFELGVARRGGLAALQPTHELGEAGPRPIERVLLGAHRRRPVVSPPPPRRARSRAKPASAWASSSALAAS